MAEGGPPLDETRAYFRGIRSALTAIEKRLGAMAEPTAEDALREIRRYRESVAEHLAALDHVADGRE